MCTVARRRLKIFGLFLLDIKKTLQLPPFIYRKIVIIGVGGNCKDIY